jgi:hypothetical protein
MVLGNELGILKCQTKLHSQDSLEHLMWNVCTELSHVVCLFVCLFVYALGK